MFYEKAAWGARTRLNRIIALTSLAKTHFPGNTMPAPLIVAPVRAVMTRTLPRRDFIKAMKTLFTGKSYPFHELQKNWAGIGYQKVDIVSEPGQYSQRGGILDIWTPAEQMPVRLDFFGTDLDSIRRFDPATQRTIETIDKILVTPAREVLPAYFHDDLPIHR